jgi:hypothetical protein
MEVAMDAQGFMPGDEVVAGIKADLGAYEAERSKAHRAVMWRVPVFLGLTLAATALLAWGFNDFADPHEQWFSSPHVFLYIAAFALAFFVYGLAISPATRLQQSFRSKVLPAIFGFIKGMQYRHNSTPDSFDRLPREATGTFNRQSFDDLVAGRYEDFPFELYEANLRQKAGKSDATVFKGVIVAFETITPFPGLLVAVRKAGSIAKFFRGMFGTKLEILECGVPDIDDAYEFQTDNATAARPLVTGRLAQALKWLSESWPEQPAKVALSGSDGFLLLPTGRNFFELPGISVPLDYKAHVEPMVADMVTLLATAALVRKVGAPDDVGELPAAQS